MTKEELRAKVRDVLARAQKHAEERRAAGMCVEPECQKPAAKDPKLFFGEDHCEEHARKYELEFLIEDQEDDDGKSQEA